VTPIPLDDEGPPEFTVVMRGYDRHQVDDYVSALREFALEADSRTLAAEAALAEAGMPATAAHPRPNEQDPAACAGREPETPTRHRLMAPDRAGLGGGASLAERAETFGASRTRELAGASAARLDDSLPGLPAVAAVGRRRRRRDRMAFVLVVLVLLAVAGTAGVLIAHRQRQPVGDRTGQAAAQAGRQFLAAYVAPDGRVVRRDQGGDTVSEGQSYALLVSVALGDRRRFATVWAWTRTHLSSRDGLLSWHWQNGRVQDPHSAADADLDAAQALLLAATRFDQPGYATAAHALGAAILAHETVRLGRGRLLLAGDWETGTPYLINVSYFSPAAFRLLGDATGDPRWKQLAATSRSELDRLTAGPQLPPDWASVTGDGVVSPAAHGGRTVFGLDAARMPTRYAASCNPADRQLAAQLAPLLGGRAPDRQRAVYDLSGAPQVSYDRPVERVAAAATAHTAGDRPAAAAALDQANELQRAAPTYYGSAWVALGHILLNTSWLPSC
jgi:endo-1,4-beta-D-glucanase Y